MQYYNKLLMFSFLTLAIAVIIASQTLNGIYICVCILSLLLAYNKQLLTNTNKDDDDDEVEEEVIVTMREKRQKNKLKKKKKLQGLEVADRDITHNMILFLYHGLLLLEGIRFCLIYRIMTNNQKSYIEQLVMVFVQIN